MTWHGFCTKRKKSIDFFAKGRRIKNMAQEYILALAMCYKFFAIVISVQLIASLFITRDFILAGRCRTKEFICVVLALAENIADFTLLLLMHHQLYVPPPMNAVVHIIWFWIANIYLVWYWQKVIQHVKKFIKLHRQDAPRPKVAASSAPDSPPRRGM
jgi:hypothetical protein